MAIEIVNFPIKNGDFPVRYVNVYQRVSCYWLYIYIYLIKYPSIDIPDSFIHTNDIPLVGSPSHRNPGGVSRPLRCQDSAVRPESRLCPHCCASETTAERLGKKGDRTRKNGELPREKWQKMLISAAKNADRTALNQLK